MKVPWLSKKQISGNTHAILSRYQDLAGRRVVPPIPVEDIIERYFDLNLGFVDFEQRFGMEDVLGACYVDQRLICVNEALLDSRQSEGRINFTWAHELGHWVMHRHLLDRMARCDRGADRIFCRAREAKKPIEWQADYFAGCLLMPEKSVLETFRRVYGPDPLRIFNVEKSFAGPICFDPCVENWHLIAAEVRHTGNFSNVSNEAMMIRLQELGLVINETKRTMRWEKRRDSRSP